MKNAIILFMTMVLFSASMVAAHPFDENDFVAVVTGIDTRAQPTRPYYVEYQNGFIRRFHNQEQDVVNDIGIFYSYEYPRIYPRIPDELRSYTGRYTHSVKITEFVDELPDRHMAYVYDPGYLEKGYSQVTRSLPLNAIPREDRAFSRPSRRIYDNGPRIDIS